MAKASELESLAKHFGRGKVKVKKGKVEHPPLDGFVPVKKDSLKEEIDKKEDKKP